MIFYGKAFFAAVSMYKFMLSGNGVLQSSGACNILLVHQ